ncbi:MAG: DUF2948 family protein [Alphaproteobacteria bacterium]|nr:DUF2948 family protein [Alphaproteobacteria bacterium]
MLRLTAADEADLSVISAQMQDALMKRAELVFDARRRRFALVANRFAWDDAAQRQRRRAGLHFDDVRAVRVHGLGSADGGAILSLLAITFEGAEAPAGRITLHFAAGIQIRLEVDAINATLADLGGVWAAAAVPDHQV